MSKVEVGKVAPSFTLQNQDGDEVSLKDFKGKKYVVLYFYPKAMTPGCTVQACGIKENKKRFSSKKAVVLGVSTDPVEKLKKFEEKYKLNFDLLSDEDHKIADKYGVWGLKKFMGKEFMGLIRTTFIIDKNGKVAHIMDNVKTKSHDEDVLEVLKSL